MDNQHKKIKGYRDLTQNEIDVMNSIKAIAEQVKEITDGVSNIEGVDKRWLNIGITDLQKGFMAVTRSVARPTTF